MTFFDNSGKFASGSARCRNDMEETGKRSRQVEGAGRFVFKNCGYRQRIGIVALGLSMLASSSALRAQTNILQPAPNFNFYGQIGLLDMPTARFAPDGEFATTFSSTRAGERYTLDFQALPWLEADFRYSRVDNWGPDFDDYDRSLSFKIRLLEEKDYWPSLAIGVEDILGTGVYGAEYVVASKKIGDLDFTAGMGWRRFGETATFPNPLGVLFHGFKTVNNNFGNGGTPSLGVLFHGPKVGLFGGVSWQTPIDGLQLVVELSGDKYSQQSMDGAIKINTPVNVGFSYEPWRGIQVGGGYLYGSQLGIRVTFHLNPFDEPDFDRYGPPPLPAKLRAPEARRDAQLAYVQKKTHFYDNVPVANILKGSVVGGGKIGDRAAVRPDFVVDALFDGASAHNLQIENVETFGTSLIVDVRGSRQSVSCASVAGIVNGAGAAGFTEIVLSASDDPRDVKICATQSPIGPRHPQPLQYADLVATNDNRYAVDDGSPAMSSAPLSSPTPDLKAVRQRIINDANQQSIFLVGLDVSKTRIEVIFLNRHYRTQTEAMGRLIRILMFEAPDSVEEFRLVASMDYLPAKAVVLRRSDIERTIALDGSADELLPTTDILSVAGNDPLAAHSDLLHFPTLDLKLEPGFRQSLFDPTQPYRYGFYGKAIATAIISRHFALSVVGEFNIYNTLNTTLLSNSVLPHVRSDFPLYFREGSNGIGAMTASYVTNLAPDVYFLGRAGILESMFAGAGGEILWRPEEDRFAFGAALYAVRQRGFDRLFDLQKYGVVTGHISAYYNSPFYNLDFAVHAGRYLAGDYGATFELTRHFDSGIEIGGYFTLTNVPFSKFGEGSFDKGIIVHIPLDFLLPINTQDDVRLDFSPLTRDGGARLLGEQTLFEATREMTRGDWLPTWDEILRP